jgi:glycosyltransferase involved in cell wall biosynthesis
MSHREAIRFQRGAHALLLLESDDPRGSLVLPGKVFEYLAARRPIVSIAPDGAVRDLLGPLETALQAPPSDPQAVADILSRVAGGNLPPPVSQEALLPFTRETLTRKLADLLDQVLAEREGHGWRRPPEFHRHN